MVDSESKKHAASRPSPPFPSPASFSSSVITSKSIPISQNAALYVSYSPKLIRLFENALPKRVYQVSTSFDITFSKNHILSFVLNLDSISDNYGPLYEDVYHFNIDLLNGNSLTLKDLFNEGVDYLPLLSQYVNDEIAKTPELFYENTVVDIPDSQAFYITDKGIVLYFEVDEIAQESAGVPKFLISFEQFGEYINPRFYCNPENLLRRKRRR